MPPVDICLYIHIARDNLPHRALYSTHFSFASRDSLQHFSHPATLPLNMRLRRRSADQTSSRISLHSSSHLPPLCAITAHPSLALFPLRSLLLFPPPFLPPARLPFPSPPSPSSLPPFPVIHEQAVRLGTADRRGRSVRLVGWPRPALWGDGTAAARPPGSTQRRKAATRTPARRRTRPASPTRREATAHPQRPSAAPPRRRAAPCRRCSGGQQRTPLRLGPA